MLEQETIKKIESFVYSQPRTIDEISKHIDKNWRTAERYVLEIEKEFGTITTKIFRKGTRGALKIVYWASIEKASHSVFQEMLEKDILSEKNTQDFSAFEIYQFVPHNKKTASVEVASDENKTDIEQLVAILRNTKNQLLIFSGNLSFINLKNKELNVFGEIEKAVKRGVNIKAVCIVDLVGKENVEKLLSLNFKYGKEVVEIRHKQQPLRGMTCDKQTIRFKEVKEPTGKINELNKKKFIFYTINDKEWSDWLSKIFWKMFSSSLDAKKRIDELKELA